MGAEATARNLSELKTEYDVCIVIILLVLLSRLEVPCIWRDERICLDILLKLRWRQRIVSLKCFLHRPSARGLRREPIRHILVASILRGWIAAYRSGGLSPVPVLSRCSWLARHIRTLVLLGDSFVQIHSINRSSMRTGLIVWVLIDVHEVSRLIAVFVLSIGDVSMLVVEVLD